MRPITYARASTPKEAVHIGTVPAASPVTAPVQYLAGGTQPLDLAELDVMRPERLVGIARIANVS